MTKPPDTVTEPRNTLPASPDSQNILERLGISPGHVTKKENVAKSSGNVMVPQGIILDSSQNRHYGTLEIVADSAGPL